MPAISDNALTMAVQAIYQISQRLSVERDAIDGPEQADYDEIIEAYEIAGMELRRVFEAALADGADLPPYAQLVR